MKRLFCLYSVLLLAVVGPARGEEKSPPARILMVTQSGGFKHSSVTRKDQPLSVAEQAFTEMGVSSGLFRVDCSQNIAEAITKEKLAGYQIVVFYTTGKRDELPSRKELGEEKFKAWESERDYLFQDWVKQKGHGFVGVHSAADTYADYPPYYEMLGGTFKDHPWTANSIVTVTVDDPEHPIAKPFGKEFVIQDEIYHFKNWKPENVRVLMSLNMEKTDKKESYHVPIAWIKQYGQGRVFHMSLGHREETWADSRFRESLLAGIRWELGLISADATPNPEVSEQEDAKAKLASDRE
jgi:type 1 glutamine amidotransferase